MANNKGPFLWVAFDGLAQNEAETLDLAKELDRVPGNFGSKANLDWALMRGMKEARALLPDRPAFLDIKMWNGASTMARVFEGAHHAGFTAVNAYALAGGKSVDEEGAELRKAIASFRAKIGKTSLRIYAVTVLTHYADEYCKLRFRRDMLDQVRAMGREGLQAGADGLILPGTMLGQFPGEILKISPGLRLDGFADDRHKHEYRPEDIAGREDVEPVCGSPVYKSDDPVGALKKILAALQK